MVKASGPGWVGPSPASRGEKNLVLSNELAGALKDNSKLVFMLKGGHEVTGWIRYRNNSRIELEPYAFFNESDIVGLRRP